MTDISELIERVKGATGPDRGLDARLAVFGGDVVMRDGGERGFAFFDTPVKRGDWAFLGGCKNGPDDAYDSLSQCLNIRHYTASTDAALALVERVRPGWVCDTLGQDATGRLGDMRGTGWTAEFSNGLQSCQGQAPTLPLAIILALLLSLQSEADK